MAANHICSDFGAPKNKVSHCFHCFPCFPIYSSNQLYFSHTLLQKLLGPLSSLRPQHTGGISDLSIWRLFSNSHPSSHQVPGTPLNQWALALMCRYLNNSEAGTLYFSQCPWCWLASWHVPSQLCFIPASHTPPPQLLVPEPLQQTACIWILVAKSEGTETKALIETFQTLAKFPRSGILWE